MIDARSTINGIVHAAPALIAVSCALPGLGGGLGEGGGGGEGNTTTEHSENISDKGEATCCIHGCEVKQHESSSTTDTSSLRAEVGPITVTAAEALRVKNRRQTPGAVAFSGSSKGAKLKRRHCPPLAWVLQHRVQQPASPKVVLVTLAAALSGQMVLFSLNPQVTAARHPVERW